ncbi:hypothetical protein BN439_2855 [Erwinia amylovora Ea644]|nr:hypothetical protein BN439_2855 [Erwinia amylovora Ea644]
MCFRSIRQLMVTVSAVRPVALIRMGWQALTRSQPNKKNLPEQIINDV